MVEERQSKRKVAIAPTLLRVTGHIVDALSHPAERWFRFRPPLGLFQPFNDTRLNRYPRIFRFAQEQLGQDSKASILSFGCSTGEEVFSLRRYFPNALLKGIDINPRNVAAAQRHLRATSDVGITFAVANSTDAERTEGYDAIFCMATLRHGGLVSTGAIRCDHLIVFNDFARVVADFERCLKPGGLLFIVNSNFRLIDTPIARHFTPILGRFVEDSDLAKTPIFGPDNLRKADVSFIDLGFCKSPRSDEAKPASSTTSPMILR